MNRTTLCALAAVGALLRVDMRTVVLNGDCAKFADALTFFTADTAKLAGNCNCLTFCVGAAGYTCLFVIWYQLDQVTRTSLRTLTTGNTLLLVDNGNTVYNMDRVKLTCLHTASRTETSVVTALGAAARNCICDLVTVVNTIIVVFHGCLIAGTFTFYKCNLLLSGTSLNAHDRSDLFSYRSAADRTLVNLCLALCNCFCKSITACVTAAAAVVARKLCTNQNFLLVYFYFKLLAGDSKEYADDDTDDTDNRSSDDNACHVHLSFLLKSFRKIRRERSTLSLL